MPITPDPEAQARLASRPCNACGHRDAHTRGPATYDGLRCTHADCDCSQRIAMIADISDAIMNPHSRPPEKPHGV